MNKGDRYVGLVTIFALLLTVFYSGGKYDEWDVFLGIVGILAAINYWPDLAGKDVFFTSLIAAIFSSSVVAICCVIVQNWPDAQKAIGKIPFVSSFWVFLLLFTVLAVVLRYITIKKKAPTNVTPL